MNNKLLPNCKYGFTLSKDDISMHYLVKDTLESMIHSPLDKSIEYMFDKLMRALPNDTARLFFLQSELLSDELKEYQTNKIIRIRDHNYKHKYYIEVKTKLNQLKEQYEQIRL